MNTTDNQIKVLTAFKMGKAIEVLCENDTWKEIKEEVADFYPFNFATETYRVKPAIRPYKSAAEFLAAQQQHGPYFKLKSNPIHHYLPHKVEDEGIDNASLGFCEYSFLLDSFVWQDGTLCGIEEEIK